MRRKVRGPPGGPSGFERESPSLCRSARRSPRNSSHSARSSSSMLMLVVTAPSRSCGRGAGRRQAGKSERHVGPRCARAVEWG